MTDLNKDKLPEIIKKVNKTGYGYYYNTKNIRNVLTGKHSFHCSDMDRVPSNAEKIDEKTVRMKVKKD